MPPSVLSGPPFPELPRNKPDNNRTASVVGDADDIAVADLNHDGNLDVVGFEGGAVRVLLTKPRPVAAAPIP